MLMCLAPLVSFHDTYLERFQQVRNGGVSYLFRRHSTLEKYFDVFPENSHQDVLIYTYV